jgi:hypothetical protein
MTGGAGWSVGGRGLPGGARSSAGMREERVPFRVITRDGPWAHLAAGPDGFPRPVFYFFCSFLFSNSVFLFNS